MTIDVLFYLSFERLAETGEWLFECGGGEALLARLDRTSDFVPDGQKPENRPSR